VRERDKHTERDREKRRGQADSNTGRAGLADDVLLTEVLMLQTIYEADSCFSADGIGKHRLPLTPHNADMHNVNNSGDWFFRSLSVFSVFIILNLWQHHQESFILPGCKILRTVRLCF